MSRQGRNCQPTPLSWRVILTGAVSLAVWATWQQSQEPAVAAVVIGLDAPAPRERMAAIDAVRSWSPEETAAVVPRLAAIGQADPVQSVRDAAAEVLRNSEAARRNPLYKKWFLASLVATLASLVAVTRAFLSVRSMRVRVLCLCAALCALVALSLFHPRVPWSPSSNLVRTNTVKLLLAGVVLLYLWSPEANRPT